MTPFPRAPDVCASCVGKGRLWFCCPFSYIIIFFFTVLNWKSL